MAYLVRDLIADAYYLSGVVSRSFQTVTGDQTTLGLRLFNTILSNKSADSRLVPYFSEYVLTGVIGQEKYFIPNLIYAETFTFNIDNVRYPSVEVGRKDYFGTGRADDVNSLPFTWHMEKVKDGTDLYLYYKPVKEYQLKIWGKFGFDSVELTDDLETTFELWYANYLQYELAQYICDSYGVPLPVSVATNLESIRKRSYDDAPLDLKVTKRSRLGTREQFVNYAHASFKNSWYPGRW